MTERQWEPADDDIIASPRQVLDAESLDAETRGGIVRGLLQSRLLTPAAAASLMGVSRSTVSRWQQACSSAQLRRVGDCVRVVVVRVGE